MSEAIEPSLRKKLWMTPWRDVLRGRLTLRLDVAALIQAAEIPENAKTVIFAVVRQTRLWRSEKVAVAEELIAHFADGMEAGEPIERLIEKFGDVRQAAKLIRRAKIRNRPVIWRAMRIAVRIVQLMILVHLLLATYFYAGHPSPNIDYVAQLNERAFSTPENQRAWPLYRQAILKTADFKPPDELFDDPTVDELAPGGKGWPWMMAWLRQHQEALDLIRQGAAKPALGFIYGAHGSTDDPAIFPNYLCRIESGDVESSHPNYVVPIQWLPLHLRRDSDLAIQDRDSARFVRDITAILGMAEQLRREEFIVGGRLAQNSRVDAVYQINAALTQQPDLLSDLQLQTLAHEIAGFGDAAEMFDLRANKLEFYDDIQRAFTDNGSGDGRLTRKLDRGRWGNFNTGNQAKMFTFGPWIMALMASRGELVDRFDRWEQLAEADLHRPLRDLPQGSADAFLEAMLDSSWQSHRDIFLLDSVIYVSWTRANVEMLLGERDGVEVGLALEMYRRHHGQYPQSIQELVPALLPAAPIDRITGDPVKYRLVKGRPVVYSVGVDRKDDGGRSAIVHGETDNRAAARWPLPNHLPNQRSQPIPDGDWILYPLPDELNLARIPYGFTKE